MRSLLILTTLFLASCAEFAGNGVSINAEWTEPETGATINLTTAK